MWLELTYVQTVFFFLEKKKNIYYIAKFYYLVPDSASVSLSPLSPSLTGVFRHNKVLQLLPQKYAVSQT